MPKTAVLLIRLTPEDRTRLDRLAERLFLDTSTWARQQLLLALEVEEPKVEARTPPKRPAKKKTG